MNEFETAAVIAQLECLRDEIEAGHYRAAIEWLEIAIKFLKRSISGTE